MLTLSDRLAVTRTDLANERTLLAYGRTALTLMAAGVGIVELFTAPALVAAGWALVPAGALVFGVGAYRYRRTRHTLRALREPAP
jgi:putative membrane protein